MSGGKDRRVEAYIAGARPFARPILNHIRALVHRGCPGAEEAIKWNMPAFLHRGKILCATASFTSHASLTFWHGRLLVKTGYLPAGKTSAMGQLGRITKVADLPPAPALLRAIKQGMALIENGAPSPIAERKSRPDLPVPPDLGKALAKNSRARTAFAKFPPSHRREYIQWITEAKRPETRARRLATAVSQISRGLQPNWRYVR